jgi:predicted SPOUT superfamily RNA methylase MTH1
VLLVFGGLDGLELALKSDKSINENNPADLFQYYVNSLPDQGSRIIRTEEAIPITLTAIKIKLDS